MGISDKPSNPVSNETAIEVRNVTKHFGDFTALSNVSLSIRKGEFFSLLGPSGCGKTTLLRIIAGFEFPTEGEVLLGGKNVADVPAYLRPVNTVFQSYALFPHLNVRDNISFGLRMKKLPKDEIVTKVDRVMEMVRINQFADRKPSQLSGGQRQRVALARAVVNEPEVLLLDEPLGALDLKLRKELQVELMNLQRRLGISFICVTHDQEEALVMSDRIAVVNEGRIEQLGVAEEMYENPRTRFVSNFLGSSNVLHATVKERKAGSLLIETEIGTLSLELDKEPKGAASNQSFNVAIRPEKVSLSEQQKSGENIFPVLIKELIYIGSETHYMVESQSKSGGKLISAEKMNALVGSQGLEIGDKAYAYFPPTALKVLED